MVSHPSSIEIDLGQLKKNIATIKNYLGKTRYCLPVKANAYGHGLIPVAKTAQEAGIDYLAVAHLQEGAALRNAGISIPILVLGAIHEDQIEDLVRLELEFTISSKFKADLVAQKCKTRCKVHLEIDTGMQRTGVRPSTAPMLFEHLKKLNCFEVVGIYSHFVSSDVVESSHTTQQLEAFSSLLQDPVFKDTNLIRHIANSGGSAHCIDSHLDMVRPSLMTFGYHTSTHPELTQIKPCFTVKSKVSYVKTVEAGQGVSYGHSYTTSQKTRIVTVPVGYGDGYRRALSNKGSVLIRGKRFPVAGTVCMDQFMVDVGQQEVYVADEVVLLGKQGVEEITLSEMARLCDTIPYEILCGFNDRLPRVFLHGVH